MIDENFTTQHHFFTGEVEDINDPMKLGRVRVRVHAVHQENTELLSTQQLPWCSVLLPTTSAGYKGYGQTPRLLVGSWVQGFFRDGERMQDGVIIGSLPGYNTTNRSNENVRTNDINDLANNDARHVVLDTIEQYRQNNQIDISTANIEASNITIASPSFNWSFPTESYNTEYPYNFVLENGVNGETGHIIELDATPESERLLVRHVTGTGFETIASGTKKVTNTNEVYVYTKSNRFEKTGGAKNETIGNHYKLFVNQQGITGDHYDIHIGRGASINIFVEQGDINLHTGQGNMNTYINGNVRQTVTGNYNLLVQGNKTEEIVGTSQTLTQGNVTLTGNRIDLNPSNVPFVPPEIPSGGGGDGGDGDDGGMEPADMPTIGSVSPTSFSGAIGTTFTLTGTNFVESSVVDFITQTMQVVNAANVRILSENSIQFDTPRTFLANEGPVSIRVSNDNGVITLMNAIQTGSSPIWTTAADLGMFMENTEYSIAFEATDADGQDVTISLQTGSTLPGTLALAEDSVAYTITGTMPSVTVDENFTFTLVATDTLGNETTRTFTLEVLNVRNGLTEDTAFESIADAEMQILEQDLDDGVYYINNIAGTTAHKFQFANQGGQVWMGMPIGAKGYYSTDDRKVSGKDVTEINNAEITHQSFSSGAPMSFWVNQPISLVGTVPYVEGTGEDIINGFGDEYFYLYGPYSRDVGTAVPSGDTGNHQIQSDPHIIHFPQNSYTNDLFYNKSYWDRRSGTFDNGYALNLEPESFNANTDTVTAVKNCFQEFTNQNDEWTIEGHFKFSSLPSGWRCLFFIGNVSNNSENTILYGFYPSANTTLLTTDSGDQPQRSVSGNFNTNDWFHVALVCTGSELQLYMNGVRQDNISNNFNGPLSNCHFALGNDVDGQADTYDNGSNQRAPGYFTNLRISRTARYDAASFTPPTTRFTDDADTVALFPLDFDLINKSENSPNYVPPTGSGTTKRNASLFLRGETNGTIERETVTFVNSYLQAAERQFGRSSLRIDDGLVFAEGENSVIKNRKICEPTSHQHDYTFETWVNFDSLTSTNATYLNLFTIGAASGGTNFASFGVTSDGLIRYYAYTNTGSYRLTASSGTVTTNTWHHIAFCYDDSTQEVTFYLDGTRVFQQTLTSGQEMRYWGSWDQATRPISQSSFAGAHGIVFGGNGNVRMTGYLDELRISESVRYTGASFTVPTEPFVNDDDTLLLLHMDSPTDTENFDIQHLADDCGEPTILTKLNDGGQDAQAAMIFDYGIEFSSVVLEDFTVFQPHNNSNNIWGTTSPADGTTRSSFDYGTYGSMKAIAFPRSTNGDFIFYNPWDDLERNTFPLQRDYGVRYSSTAFTRNAGTFSTPLTLGGDTTQFSITASSGSRAEDNERVVEFTKGTIWVR